MAKKNREASSDEDEKQKREAAPGERHRRHKELVEVKEVAHPGLAAIGTAHVLTDAVISGGPHALLANDKNAKVLASEYGEVFGDELKAQWTWETDWLLKLRSTERGRAQANYAMLWRPMFLAVVALTHGIMLGCRAAGVADNTVAAHRNADPDFDAQVIAAQAHCIQLLHSVTMRDAIEGVLEPVLWQGITVAYVRKVDNRLRIEMLRAHMPETFKTPGSKVNINTGNQFIGGGGPVGDQEIQELMAMRARSLEKIANARVVEVPQLEVGTDPAAPLPSQTCEGSHLDPGTNRPRRLPITSDNDANLKLRIPLKHEVLMLHLKQDDGVRGGATR